MTNNQLQVKTGTIIDFNMFLSLDEAAEQLGVSYSGLRDYFKHHPEVKAKYVFKEKYNGRRRFVIKVEALPQISIVRNLDGKNKKVSDFKKGKEMIAEKAIETLKPKLSRMEMLKESLKNVQALIEQEKKLDNHEDRISTIEDELASDMAITTGQRQQLHERVNLLHYELEKRGINIPQAKIYLKMHDETGRPSINDYKFEDYRVAKRVLKDWFKKLNINWN